MNKSLFTVRMSVLIALLFNIILLARAIYAAAAEPDMRNAPAPNKPLPSPTVVFTGKEIIQTQQGVMNRYNLAVTNYQSFPPELFAPAPNLPPCGTNKNSARTWVDIDFRDPNTKQAQRIFGFCALGSPQDLLKLWFALPSGQRLGGPIYIVLNDRAAKKNYVSNPVDINPPPPATKPSGKQ